MAPCPPPPPPKTATASESDTDTMDSDDDVITIDENIRNHKYRWRSVEPLTCSREFQGEEFGQPPDNFDQLMPYDFLINLCRMTFFIKFWSDDITELLVEQTNLFGVQITGKST